MFSRAHLLIERDYERLQDENLWGIEAYPLNDDNIFEWMAKITGLRGTPWESGVFRIYIKFSEHYNSHPPEICFHTIPFHPNIDMITGKPCVDFLDNWDQWKDTYSLSYILLAIQTLLSNPVLDSAVNQEAVNLIKYSPHSYRQMVQDCVLASNRLEAGHSPRGNADGVISFASAKEEPQKISPRAKTPKTTASNKTAKISFEDYYTTWSGIATSKARTDISNPLLEAMKNNPSLQAAHYGLPLDELQAQMQKQLNEHNTLLYGKFRDKGKFAEDDSKLGKMEKINQMRKIYLHPRSTPRRTPISLDEGSTEQRDSGEGEEEEEWEKEVDALVSWTNNLDDQTL